MSALNVDITPNKGENPLQTIRRFSRAFNQTGIKYKRKNNRFFQRAASDLRKKRSAMARISMGKHYGKLRKLGKIEEKSYR